MSMLGTPVMLGTPGTPGTLGMHGTHGSSRASRAPHAWQGYGEWYSSHRTGRLDSVTSIFVILLKFHPFCYVHVFLFGMCLVSGPADTPSVPRAPPDLSAPESFKK